MTSFRWALTLLTLTIAIQTGWTQECPSMKPQSCPVFGLPCPATGVTFRVMQAPTMRPCPVEECTCTIYSLADFGEDASVGKWIADTIPTVIEPGTWNREGTSGKKNVINYFAPKKVLVVYHTTAVQVKVDAFLKDLKKSMAPMKERTATTMPDQGVTRASYQAPCACSPAPVQNGNYPITAPATPPKHLFHFIIRYEGAGIIDDSVIKYAQVQNGNKAAAESCDSSNPWVEFLSVLAKVFGGGCQTTVSGLNGASPGALACQPTCAPACQAEGVAPKPIAQVETVKVEKDEALPAPKPIAVPCAPLCPPSGLKVKEVKEEKKETEEKKEKQPQMPTVRSY
jgi:hypothetical protein